MIREAAREEGYFVWNDDDRKVYVYDTRGGTLLGELKYTEEQNKQADLEKEHEDKQQQMDDLHNAALGAITANNAIPGEVQGIKDFCEAVYSDTQTDVSTATLLSVVKQYATAIETLCNLVIQTSGQQSGIIQVVVGVVDDH